MESLIMSRLLLLVLILALATPANLTQAIRRGDVKKVQAILAKNPQLVDSREGKFGSPPLHTAVSKHQVTIVKLLLQSGADVNAGNDMRITALHLCAQFNYPDLARLLLDNGADPNILTKTGVSPLRLALANRNERVAEVLRSGGGR